MKTSEALRPISSPPTWNCFPIFFSMHLWDSLLWDLSGLRHVIAQYLVAIHSPSKRTWQLQTSALFNLCWIFIHSVKHLKHTGARHRRMKLSSKAELCVSAHKDSQYTNMPDGNKNYKECSYRKKSKASELWPKKPKRWLQGKVLAVQSGELSLILRTPAKSKLPRGGPPHMHSG